jgi:hypothetical protein
MTQPAWNMSDEDGNLLTASEAEARLCHVISDPQLAQKYWVELGRVDPGLQVLAMIVNPSLRERLWDTLDEEAKFYFVVYNRPLPCDRATLVRDVVHDVCALYHVPWQETK